MPQFEPLGEKSRWRIIYDLLSGAETDTIVTYDEMTKATDATRTGVQLAMRRASEELERTEKRAVEAVPNVGYRIVQAEEHLRLARGQQRRAGKALKRGKSKVVNVNYNDVQPEVRRAFEVMAQAITLQIDFNDRMAVRQSKLEAAVSSVMARGERTDAEIAVLHERLKRLEGN